MEARSFTDSWSGLQIYDRDWRLVDVEHALGGLARERAMRRRFAVDAEGLSTRPVKAILELTSACNLRCGFCYNESGEAADILSDQELMDVIDELCELQVLEVVLTGGEVLTVPDRLEAALARLTEAGVGVLVLSNGMLLTPEWARRFARHGVISVQVSVDGADPQVHDDIRGVEGSWRRAIDSLAYLSRAGVYGVGAAVVTWQNADSIADFIDLLYCIGADYALVGDVIPRGRAEDSLGDWRITDEQYVDLLHLVRDRALRYRDLMTVNIGTDEALSLKLQLARKPEGLLIRADGSVTPGCTLPVEVGSVRERSIGEIWREQFADLPSNPEVAGFAEDLMVAGVGEERLLRVFHRDTISAEAGERSAS
jgi:MoaA/NifB/PqqE/SkfB family radical SAM enzyme